MSNIWQKIDGEGNVQAGRDVILNIVEGVHSFRDINKAITDLHLHIDSLRWKRGKTDNLLLLALVVGVAVAAGLKLWNAWAILPFSAALILLHLGGRMRRSVDKIESEVKAAELVLVEMYKQKIMQQIKAV